MTETPLISSQRSDFAPQAVMNDKKSSSCSFTTIPNDPCPLICKRGKRGKRGKTGPMGATGATGAAAGCGLGEIFMTATELVGCGEGPEYPFNYYLFPYDGCFAVPVWIMFNFDGVVGYGASGTFNVPIDLDNTQPVTAVIHLLIRSTDGTIGGSNANIQVNMAYLSNNEIGGTNPPATGYSDAETSGDFTVIPPDTVSDSNVRQLSISIPLDPTVITAGDWAYILVTRIPALTDEYQDNIFLSTLSIQYSRLCS